MTFDPNELRNMLLGSSEEGKETEDAEDKLKTAPKVPQTPGSGILKKHEAGDREPDIPDGDESILPVSPKILGIPDRPRRDLSNWGLIERESVQDVNDDEDVSEEIASDAGKIRVEHMTPLSGQLDSKSGAFDREEIEDEPAGKFDPFLPGRNDPLREHHRPLTAGDETISPVESKNAFENSYNKNQNVKPDEDHRAEPVKSVSDTKKNEFVWDRNKPEKTELCAKAEKPAEKRELKSDDFGSLRDTFLRAPEPEPVKGHDSVDKETVGTIQDNADEAESETAGDSDAGHASGRIRAGKKGERVDTKKTGARVKNKKPKPEFAQPPSPLSLLALIGGLLSLLSAVGTLYLNNTGSASVGLTAIGVALVLLFTGVNSGWIREMLSSRSARYSTNISIAVLSFLGILVLINILSYRYHYRLDLSAEGIHTLSPQTQSVLADLNRAGEPVSVIAFVGAKDSYRLQISELVDKYTYYTDLVDFRFVDPDIQRELTEQSGIETIPSLLFEQGDQKKIVSDIDEQHFTYAMLAVRQSHAPVVYFVTGHDEPDLFSESENGLSQLRERLELENFTVKTLNIPAENGVPRDAALVVVIAPPQRNFSTMEIQSLDTYLNGGGSLVCFLEPGRMAGLEPILAKYGMVVKDGVVLDDQRNYYNELSSPLISSSLSHAITQSLDQDLVFLMAASLDYTSSSRLPGVQIESLAMTNNSAWLETGDEFSFMEGSDNRDFYEMAMIATRPIDAAPVAEEIPEEVTAQDEVNEPDGPYAAEIETEEEPVEGDVEVEEPESILSEIATVLLVADSSFLLNANIDISYNRDFALNAIDYITSQHELISIRPAVRERRDLELTGIQKNIIFAFSVILTPLLIAGIGAMVWGRRR